MAAAAFLPADASDEELLAATADSVTAWIERAALAGGGHTGTDRGVAWSWQPVPHRELTVPFPPLDRDDIGDAVGAVLDRTRELGAARIGIWSLAPSAPPETTARLAERGFHEGFRPHWMARSLDDLAAAPPPPGVAIAEVTELADWDAQHLPYHDPALAPVRHALAQRRPRDVWHLAAFRDGEAVGHTSLSLTRGSRGVAGLYDLGVVYRERRRGIGRALTLAACDAARREGARVAVLNATPDGEPLYRALGFRSLGSGRTWWLTG